MVLEYCSKKPNLVGMKLFASKMFLHCPVVWERIPGNNLCGQMAVVSAEWLFYHTIKTTSKPKPRQFR